MFPVPWRADWYIQDSRLGYSQRFAACEKDFILVAYGQTFTNTHAGHTPSALDKQSPARMEGTPLQNRSATRRSTEAAAGGRPSLARTVSTPWGNLNLHLQRVR